MATKAVIIALLTFIPAAYPSEIPARSSSELNPAPYYPAESRRLGEEGEVLLKVYVREDGQPSMVEIQRSSGYARLDDSALTTVSQWRFRPLVKNRKRVGGWAAVPVRFELTIEGERVLMAEMTARATQEAERNAQEAINAAGEAGKSVEEVAIREAARAQWEAHILEKIRNVWVRPNGSFERFHCVIKFTQASDGTITAVALDESCGNAVLDESVKRAVMAASPLPKAPNETAFILDFRIIFCPSANSC